MTELLATRGLPPVVSVASLSVMSGYSERFIGAIERRQSRYYRRFSIRRGSKFREIAAPRVALKVLQKWLGHHLSQAVGFPDHVHGFRVGCSTVTAARMHVNSQWLYSVDLKSFFDSIGPKLVHDALKDIGYPGAAAWLIANICTLSGKLPQGAPSSPVLANLVFRQADLALANISHSLGLRFTRYADDLSWSSTTSMPPNLPRLVEDTLNKYGWRLAVDKTEIKRVPERLEVLGLLVDGPAPRLSKRYRNRLRMMRHMTALNHDCKKQSQFLGHLAYGASVR